MSKKIVIVGGVAGGATTAARLRRLDETAEITIIEKGKYVSFANCGLPYYIGDVIGERDSLLLQTPESFKARFNIDVLVENEVTKVSAKENKVTIKNKDGEYEMEYDYLVLSPGSTPLKPPIPGIDSDGIFTLWTMDDTDNIKEFVTTKKPKKAVVIGGGFVGVEIAENLKDLGIKVSLIEMQNQVMAPFDFDMAQIIHREMAENGIELLLEEKVVEFSNKNSKPTVSLESGKTIESDLIILSMGVRPNTKFLFDSDIELSERKYIVTNEYMQTNIDNVFGLGDASEITDYINGKKTMIPLAGPANKQGRIVANNIVKEKSDKYLGAQGTSILKIFDLTAGSTGYNEKKLISQGMKYGEDYLVALIHSKNHAGYYPGATTITLKAIFKKEDGKLLGMQAVGYDGVAKRVDVFASAIRMNLKITDLKEFELAYAPPFSSAKDPINMLGFVGENLLDGTIKNVHAAELADIDDNTVIVDVRDEFERELGVIPNSINIPVDEIRNNLDKFDKDKTYILYCAVGVRGYIGCRILIQNGFKALNLAGGYTSYASYTCDPITSTCDFNPDVYDESGSIDVSSKDIIHLNVCGMQCPGPILQLANAVKSAHDGALIEVHATDPGFLRDVDAWCNSTGNTVLNKEKNKNEITALIRKGSKTTTTNLVSNEADRKTIVVFSGDLDKAIASLIIANGALAMGKKVSMFFTFWGLSVLRKRHPEVKEKKGFIQKMFSVMLPKGASKLGLSKMNFLGMGPVLIKKIMKDNNIEQVESLLETAMKSGAKIIACNMSMELMGIKESELIDGVELGGVATYLNDTESSNTNLFI